MGSSLSTLRTLLENQIAVGTTGADTEPTSTILNDYINKAIRQIVRDFKPRELQNASAKDINITRNKIHPKIRCRILTGILLSFTRSKIE